MMVLSITFRRDGSAALAVCGEREQESHDTGRGFSLDS